jgi:UDP-N-acetylglucosamine--N-acetylmuramyl-(pentapeptide) pyrophosphoryl-undecaprenol N-acetylglucosamine transferase
MKRPCIFICGGGTGGHFFSGLALAEAFLHSYADYEVRFVGTQNGIEGRTPLSDPRMSISFIRAKGLKGKGLSKKISGIFYLMFGVIQSLGLILKFRPEVVFGVGGYASAPTLAAALVLRIFGGSKLALLEQNSVPGLVNRLFVKLGVKAFSGFKTLGFETVDLPLRSVGKEGSGDLRKVNWPPQKILILGGSQGARGLNSKWCEVFPSVQRLMPEIQIVHQTGREDETKMKDFYQSLGARAEIFAFSNEIPKYLEAADLLICRAGAMTVFEAMAFGRPCIFVPFPFATDDHQKKNALSVQAKDWVLEEKDFNFQRVENLLKAPAPQIPRRSQEKIRSWPEIFLELLGV